MERILFFKMGKVGLKADGKEPLGMFSVAGQHISDLKQPFYFAHDSMGWLFGKSLTGWFIPDHIASAGVWDRLNFQRAS